MYLYLTLSIWPFYCYSKYHRRKNLGAIPVTTFTPPFSYFYTPATVTDDYYCSMLPTWQTTWILQDLRKFWIGNSASFAWLVPFAMLPCFFLACPLVLRIISCLFHASLDIFVRDTPWGHPLGTSLGGQHFFRDPNGGQNFFAACKGGQKKKLNTRVRQMHVWFHQLSVNSIMFHGTFPV